MVTWIFFKFFFFPNTHPLVKFLQGNLPKSRWIEANENIGKERNRSSTLEVETSTLCPHCTHFPSNSQQKAHKMYGWSDALCRPTLHTCGAWSKGTNAGPWLSLPALSFHKGLCPISMWPGMLLCLSSLATYLFSIHTFPSATTWSYLWTGWTQKDCLGEKAKGPGNIV